MQEHLYIHDLPCRISNHGKGRRNRLPVCTQIRGGNVGTVGRRTAQVGTDTDGYKDVRLNRTGLVFTVFGLMIHIGIRVGNRAAQTFQVFELLFVRLTTQIGLPCHSAVNICPDSILLTSISTGAPAALAFSDGKKLATKRRSYAQSRHTARAARSQRQKAAATAIDFLIIHYSVVLKFWEYRAIKHCNFTQFAVILKALFKIR